MNTTSDEYDSPWKEALSEYLRDCLALLFPVVEAGIDWSRPHTFLDAELQQIVRDAALGRRYADRLVRVWLPGGADAWLLIHIEVQAQPAPGFAERMFVYHYRIFDRHPRRVVSLAVLADDTPTWRPDTYEQVWWGCKVSFQYPVAKLTDWRDRRAELEASDNPFATVLLAHLAAQETHGDAPARERAKLGLIRRLYQRGYSQERVLSLFRFIDWLLALPPELEAHIIHAIEAIEEEYHMPYTTSIERMAREKGRTEGRQEGRTEGRQEGRTEGRQEGRTEGRQEGRTEGRQEGRLEGKREDILNIVQARFGHVPEALAARLATADAPTLDALLLRAATAASAQDV